MSNKKHDSSLDSHACLLEGGAVAFIAITKGVALSLAIAAYPGGRFTITKARPEHYAELSIDSTK